MDIAASNSRWNGKDKTLRQRIQDKILTLQKAEERKSKGQVEDWEEEESPTSFQDIDDDLIPDSLQKEKQITIPINSIAKPFNMKSFIY